MSTTIDISGLEPLQTGHFTIGYDDSIHGKGAEAQKVPLTRDEAERLVQGYLETIVAIDETAEFYGSSGGWEIRAKPYAWRRIDDFVKEGIIDAERVEKLTEEAYCEFDKMLNDREERLRKIAAAVDATFTDGRGQLGDIVFESGGEGHAPNGQFFLIAERNGTSKSKTCATIAAAVEWLLTVRDELGDNDSPVIEHRPQREVLESTAADDDMACAR